MLQAKDLSPIVPHYSRDVAMLWTHDAYLNMQYIILLARQKAILVTIVSRIHFNALHTPTALTSLTAVRAYNRNIFPNCIKRNLYRNEYERCS